MFLGHYAVACAAKRVAPAASLGTLFAAAAFLDLVWPVLLLVGVERVRVAPGITAFTPLDFEHYPISHSLAMSVVWGVAFGAVYFALRRNARAAVVLAALVVSHWLLDAVVHRPDLPLTLGGVARIGLGLWNSIPATLAVELALFAVGVAIYVRATAAHDRVSNIRLATFLVLLVAIYAVAAFGPPPSSVAAIAGSDLVGQLLVVLLAGWVDRHRSLRPG